MDKYNKFDDRYADLLLKKCLKDQEKMHDKLLIMIDLWETLDFANVVRDKALELGYKEVVINIEDQDEVYEFLLNSDVESIKDSVLFNRSILDEYARENNPILFIDSRVPNLMSDIDASKLDVMAKTRGKSSSFYRANVGKRIFPWSLTRYPNERWAKSIFGDNDEAYDKLYNAIAEACMIDRDDFILEWDKFIETSNSIKENLNNLGISSLHFSNELGTDLTVGLLNGYRFLNLDKGTGVINNMPSYEIFTSPDYRKTNGIVYSSKPLFHLGSVIEDFWIEFKDGKAVNFDAKRGKELLGALLSNTSSSVLGEVALVDKDSPLAKMNINFNDILYDENCSCHLALGAGTSKSIIGGDEMSKEELDKLGINFSDVHVDFMIGTNGTDVYADTEKGKKLVLRKGSFTDEVIGKL